MSVLEALKSPGSPMGECLPPQAWDKAHCLVAYSEINSPRRWVGRVSIPARQMVTNRATRDCEGLSWGQALVWEQGRKATRKLGCRQTRHGEVRFPAVPCLTPYPSSAFTKSLVKSSVLGPQVPSDEGQGTLKRWNHLRDQGKLPQLCSL